MTDWTQPDLFANDPHAIAAQVSTSLGNLYITCKCGWKFGQTAYEKHLFTAPTSGAFLLEEK